MSHILASHPNGMLLIGFAVAMIIIMYLLRKQWMHADTALPPFLYFIFLGFLIFTQQGIFSGIIKTYGSFFFWFLLVPIILWIESILLSAWVHKKNEEIAEKQRAQLRSDFESTSSKEESTGARHF